MKSGITRYLSGYSYQLLLLGTLVIVVCLFSLNTPFFFRWENLRNILDQSTLNIIMAVGMTFVIGSSGIDLSVGASAALTGVICAILMKSGTVVPVAVLASLAAGAALGVTNGIFICLFRISPFIVTLGSMLVYRGLALIITGAMPVYGFPAGFTWLGRGRLSVLPVSVVICTVILIVAFFLLTPLPWGLTKKLSGESG
jgi:ribose/xylose/arabinose/galactoside ABC-type transport system permease subunit